MFRSKLWMVLMVMPWLAGCEMTPEQRVDAVDKAVTYMQAESAKFDARLAALTAVIDASQAALNDPNLPGEIAAKVSAQLAEAKGELAKIQPAKEKVDLVLADMQAKLAALKAGGAVDVAAELTAAAQVLGTVGTAVGGSTGAAMQAIAAILIAILSAAPGFIAARKRGTQLTETKTALTEVVNGGEQFKQVARAKAADELAIAAWKDAMTATQSPKTRELVAMAKASLA